MKEIYLNETINDTNEIKRKLLLMKDYLGNEKKVELYEQLKELSELVGNMVNNGNNMLDEILKELKNE